MDIEPIATYELDAGHIAQIGPYSSTRKARLYEDAPNFRQLMEGEFAYSAQVMEAVAEQSDEFDEVSDIPKGFELDADAYDLDDIDPPDPIDMTAEEVGELIDFLVDTIVEIEGVGWGDADDEERVQWLDRSVSSRCIVRMAQSAIIQGDGAKSLRFDTGD